LQVISLQLLKYLLQPITIFVLYSEQLTNLVVDYLQSIAADDAANMMLPHDSSSNADAMVLPSALMEVRHFEYYQGVNASQPTG
jgi:hypothetical protein